MRTDFQSALNYIYSFIDYEALPGASPVERNLEMIGALVRTLGRPDKSWPSIHITGTKGKGSTAGMIASMVHRNGYRVGLYTSPHLVSFRERIAINGKMISKKSFCRLVDLIRPAVGDVIHKTALRPTFFDVWTALAYLHFSEEKVDLAVVEVGLGGRLDSTNIITPVTSVITPIGLDHTDRLGTSLQAIAYEKAGIIKDEIPVISAPQEQEASSVIQDTCQRKHSALSTVGEDIQFEIRGADSTCQTFDVEGVKGQYHDLKIPLLGKFQVVNAATAIGATEALDHYNIRLTSRGIAEGLRTVQVPGRLQVIQKRPYMILDGAHNVLSARVLVETIQDLFSYRRIILVVSLHQDKDVSGVCHVLSSLADEVIVATRKVNKRRQADPEIVADAFRACDVPARVVPSVSIALEDAQAKASQDDLICITGSFIMVGEAMEVLHKLEPEEFLSR